MGGASSALTGVCERSGDNIVGKIVGDKEPFSCPVFSQQGCSGVAGSQASDSTQARDDPGDLAPSQHAVPVQGAASRCDQELRQDSSVSLEQAAVDSSPCRAQSRERDESRGDPEDDDCGSQQGRQEERRSPAPRDTCAEEIYHNETIPKLLALGHQAIQEGLPPTPLDMMVFGPQELPPVCAMVSHDSLRRECQLAHEVLPAVDQPARGGKHLHVRDHGEATAAGIRASQDPLPSKCDGLGPSFRLHVPRQHRGFLHSDESARPQKHMVL